MTYEFIKTEITEEEAGFGLKVTFSGEEKIYHSLCSSRERILKLSQLINSSKVSQCHIDDIIEDFLL